MVEAILRLPLAAEGKKTAIDSSGVSLVTAGKDLLFCELSDGAVILDLKSGVYYGLDAVGTAIWSLIQEPKPVRTILAALLDQYEVEPERCELDLRELLCEMSSLNLVEIRNEPAS